MTKPKVTILPAANLNIRLAEQSLEKLDLTYWRALLHENVVLQFPYGSVMQMPTQVAGKAAAIEFLEQGLGAQGRATFRDVSVMATADPATVIAEYARSGSWQSGDRKDQVFIAFMSFRDGRLILFREYPNRLQVFKAFGSNWPQA